MSLGAKSVEAGAAGGNYRPDIDGLRAVAVTSVLFFHIDHTLLPGGFAGVDVFFGISGYLISGIILRELKCGRFSVLEFYKRRIRRIFPALVLVLATTWVFGWLVLLSSEFQQLGEEMLAGAAFVFNLEVFRDQQWYFGASTASPLTHLWSLGVEEQFYILWPPLLLTASRFKKLRLPLLAGVTVASFASNLVDVTLDPLATFYLPWNRLWELSLGGMLAYLQRRNGGQLAFNAVEKSGHPGMCNTAALLGASLLLYALIALDGSGKTAYPGWWGLLPCTGTLLLIAAGPRTWTNRWLLGAHPVVFVGLISYPLYLWHLPLLAAARVLDWSTRADAFAAIALAFALATLTYFYVELPIRSGTLKTHAVPSLAASMVGCAALGLVTLLDAVPSRSERYGLDRLVRAESEDWLSPLQGTAHTRVVSTWTMSTEAPLLLGNGQKQVLFMGDSFMQQYFKRIEYVLAEHPHNSHGAIFMARAGCVPGGVALLNDEWPNAHVAKCRAHLQKARQYALRASVDTVVIAGAWETYFSSSSRCARVKEGIGSWRLNSQLGLEELKLAIVDLVSRGKTVYLILSHPWGANGFTPNSMLRRSMFEPFQLNAREFVPRAQTCDPRGLIGTRVREVAASAGAVVIDPKEFLCHDTMCAATTHDGEFVYRDMHLSPSYLREHANYLDQTLLDTAPSNMHGTVRRDGRSRTTSNPAGH